MTITAVHLQLTRVDRVAERNRLFWLIANIQCLWVSDQTAHRTSEYRTSGDGNTQPSE
jgi:hypothetical protein